MPHAQVVGFDMVDDESKPERRPAKHMQGPRAWDLKHNPAYAYYAYYTYANLFTLNKLREARGLNTFALRPHAGAPPLAVPCHSVCVAAVKNSVDEPAGACLVKMYESLGVLHAALCHLHGSADLSNFLRYSLEFSFP